MKYVWLPLLLCSLFILSACGYKVAGLEERANYTLFIKGVYNFSSEPDLENDIENVAVSFFSSRDAISKKDTSQFTAEIYLTKLNFDSRIVTRTGQTGTSAVTGTIEVRIFNQNGSEIYKGHFSASTIYDISNDLGDNKRKRNDAIEYVIRQSLTDFYHDFRP